MKHLITRLLHTAKKGTKMSWRFADVSDCYPGYQTAVGHDSRAGQEIEFFLQAICINQSAAV